MTFGGSPSRNLIKSRTRRIVARDPSHLFDKQHLSEDHSERLIDGWWYGTNNSASQTRAWLQRACSCAGLKWGDDFKTSLTPTIIFSKIWPLDRN